MQRGGVWSPVGKKENRLWWRLSPGLQTALRLNFKMETFVSRVCSWTRSCVVSGSTVIRCFEVSTGYPICTSTNRIYTCGIFPRRNCRVMFLGSIVFSLGILLILFPKHDELFPPFRPPRLCSPPLTLTHLLKPARGSMNCVREG